MILCGKIYENENREIKVIAFKGCPREDGNIFILITRVIEVLQQEGIDSDVFF